MQEIDLKLNRIPPEIQKILLIAVCGTGMAALASVLKEKGYEVTGSDHKTYPPMSDFLARKNIPIHEGYHKKNLSPAPDLVVVGNAVSRDNPEVKQMQQMGLPFCSMPQAVNHFVAQDKKTLLITGTHGKTTTSALLAWILNVAGLDPTFIVGGILKNFNSNYRLGKGPYLVIEGDEYDTAFFDKGPKFRHYDPYAAVLTGVEFDHADIFTDLGHVIRTFERFVAGLKPNSCLVAFDKDQNVDRIIKDQSCVMQRYGGKETSGWRLGHVTIDPPWTLFEIFKKGRPFGSFRTHLPGEHNLLNGLAAIAIADHLRISKEIIVTALESFQGVKRRQEVRGEQKGIIVIDDFAHHPTAVKETIRGIKPFCKKGRLMAVFEPRTNSSRRNIFQGVYAHSFEGADLICIRKPPLLDKIPPKERFSSEKLVQDLKRKGHKAYYFPDTDGIIDFIVTRAQPGDTILIMSNGGFDNIHERILQRLG